MVDLFLKNCKEHREPMTTLKELICFWNQHIKKIKNFGATSWVSENHSQERFYLKTRIIQDQWFNFTRLFSESSCYPCPDTIIDRDETLFLNQQMKQQKLPYMITLKKNRLHSLLKIHWQLYGTATIILENDT